MERIIKPVLILLLLSGIIVPSLAQKTCVPVASYQIQAELDPEQKTITGSLQLNWTNSSNQPVSELWFHAYLNAFRNTNSTFLKQALNGDSPFPLFGQDWPDDGWGSQTVESLTVSFADGDESMDVFSSLAFIQPEDDNKADMTVFKVDLPGPVQPGSELAINIEFVAKIPYKGVRAAFKGDFFMAGQWFPKIGVLTDAGWTCHQYHRNGEFFSDFGNYNVTLTVPAGYVVGATGAMVNSKEAGDTKIYTFEQDCVHDFAFTAFPGFLEKQVTVEQHEGNPVNVRLLYLPDHKDLANRYLDAAKHALLHFGDWYIPYPYKQLTIIDVPTDTWTGSMEYPTLITVRNSINSPKGVLGPEWTVIHELGHQFWYGLVASDESAHPWLDEGFTSYSDVRCINASYGYLNLGHTWLKRDRFAIPMTFSGIQYNPIFRRVNRLRSATTFDMINKPVWEYPDYITYKGHTYDKAALMLTTLENMLGSELFAKIMKTYAERYQYKHPVPKDFVKIVNDMAPQPMDWFFDQLLHGDAQVDFSVKAVSSQAIPLGRGLDQSGILITPGESAQDRYQSKVLIEKKGALELPVEILIEFENGESENLVWDGQDAYKMYEYNRESPVLRVVVDPAQKIMLDMDQSNNIRYRESSSTFAVKWSVRWLLWFQHLLETAASFS